MEVVAYLTHPIGEADVGYGQQRGDNLANAMEWLRFLVETTQWVICCPWFVYLTAVSEAFHRSRTLRDQIILMDRCDLIVLTGGILTPHMRIEIDHAEKKISGPTIPVVDLLHLGRKPPFDDKNRVAKEIEMIYQNSLIKVRS